MYIITTYSLYLLISIVATVWVARTLHKNGRVFLIDSFDGRDELADSVNHLLVVGFYLVNIGFVALALAESGGPIGARGVFELLGQKVGTVLLILGGMHFFNLYIFNRIRRRCQRGRIPPVDPSGFLNQVSAR